MTEQIQILWRRLECLSRDLKALWIVQKVLSAYLGGNRRWVPLTAGLYVVTEQKAEFFSHFIVFCRLPFSKFNLRGNIFQAGCEGSLYEGV